jgi:hypothetical protein
MAHKASFAYTWKSGRADYHRKLLGNQKLTETAKKAIQVLTNFGIKATIAGGYAVQHHGYPRSTEDVDIIVEDVDRAMEVLSMNGFKQAQGTSTILYDRITRIEVNLLPAGKRLSPTSLPIPKPKGEILGLSDLISNKLSSWKSAPAKRAKDLADVSELIQRNLLPRSLEVHSEVQNDYDNLWDQLQKEG